MRDHTHTMHIYTQSYAYTVHMCMTANIYIIHVPIATYYEHFHSISGYVIIECVYVFICSCFSRFITRQCNNTVCHIVLWHVDTNFRFPRNNFCSFSCLFHLWYYCKMGPATIAFSQTLQIFIYLYIYMCIYIDVYKSIYVKQILGAAFDAFWVLKSTRRGGGNRENSQQRKKK